MAVQLQQSTEQTTEQATAAAATTAAEGDTITTRCSVYRHVGTWLVYLHHPTAKARTIFRAGMSRWWPQDNGRGASYK